MRHNENAPPSDLNNKRKAVEEEVRSVFSDFVRTVELQGEVVLDSVVHSELLRRIPVIAQIVTLMKFGSDVKDLLLALKVSQFLDSMDAAQKQKLKEKLRSDEGYRTKFTLKLILVLDRISDMEKATILSKVVSAFADDRIDTSTMERLFDAVDRLFIHDLEVLTNFYNLQGKTSDFIELHYQSLQGLAISGLVGMGLQDGSVWTYQEDRFNPSRLGETLVTILQDGVPPSLRFRAPNRTRR